jgi:hypothetical protein
MTWPDDSGLADGIVVIPMGRDLERAVTQSQNREETQGYYKPDYSGRTSRNRDADPRKEKSRSRHEPGPGENPQRRDLSQHVAGTSDTKEQGADDREHQGHTRACSQPFSAALHEFCLIIETV